MRQFKAPTGAPPPAYQAHETKKNRYKSTLPGGFDTMTWLTILNALVDTSLPKEEQIHGWFEMHRSIRFTCKDLYLMSMHLLRSHYLHAYMGHVHPPYTSYPYPADDPMEGISSAQIASGFREIRVLDLFIAISVRNDVDSLESQLLLNVENVEGNRENIRRLFEHHQPQSRLEDLVIGLAIRRRLLPARRPDQRQLAVELKRKDAALRIPRQDSVHNALRTVVTVQRSSDATLESIAKQIVDNWHTHSSEMY